MDGWTVLAGLATATTVYALVREARAARLAKRAVTAAEQAIDAANEARGAVAEARAVTARAAALVERMAAERGTEQPADGPLAVVWRQER